MKKLLLSAVLFFPVDAVLAGVECEISSYVVEAYDHSGVYVHGLLDGRPVSWITICGGNLWSPTEGMDCNGPATKNRLAIALAGQTTSKKLGAFFGTINSCAEVLPYMRPQGLKLKG